MDYVTGALDATNLFIRLLELATAKHASPEVVEATNPQPLTAPISELGLPVNIALRLMRAELYTIGDVDTKTADWLLNEVRTFGKVSLAALNIKLMQAGYQPKHKD